MWRMLLVNFRTIKDRFNIYLPRLSYREQFQLALDLIHWMQQGVGVWQSLQLVHASAYELGDRRLERVSRFLLNELSAGKSLGQAFQGWGSPELVVILDSGVDARLMTQAIQKLESHTQLTNALLRSVFSQLAYPAALFATSLVALWFIGGQIIPRIAGNEGMDSLSTFAQWTLMGSRFMQYALVPMLLISLTIGGTLYLSSRAYSLPGNTFVHKSIFYQVYRLFCSVKVLNQLSLMAQYSQSLARSCITLRNYARGLTKTHYQKMLDNYASGLTELADIMDTGLLEPSSIMRLRMSSGQQKQRSSQINNLSSSISRRAESIIRQRLKVVVTLLLITSSMVVAVTITGTAQTIFTMLEHWNL